MIMVSDAVAEVSRNAHHAELVTMNRVFADVKTTDDVIALIDSGIGIRSADEVIASFEPR
jgi:hypothetical protein